MNLTLKRQLQEVARSLVGFIMLRLALGEANFLLGVLVIFLISTFESLLNFREFYSLLLAIFLNGLGNVK